MMSRFPEHLNKRLEALEIKQLRRSLSPRLGKDFSSNDYLGFAHDPELRHRWLDRLSEFPMGATGSRLLRGELEVHSQTENALARFVGRESALLYPTGYQANMGLMSSLLRETDTVFSDELNHASIIDGIRLSRAHKIIYPHFNLEALKSALERAQDSKGIKVIVTESLFSMDGDIAPLRLLADLANTYGALLIVDEAHATGLFGHNGGGIVQSLGLEKSVFASIHTGGKALGTAGGWIAGDELLKQYLVNFSRPFIFSTAPMPALLIALQVATEYWNDAGADHVGTFLARCQTFGKKLSELSRELNLPTTKAEGPIFPLILGENGHALSMADQLQAKGFDVRAIRPPTVPEGTARLRITLHHQNDSSDVEELLILLRSLSLRSA